MNITSYKTLPRKWVKIMVDAVMNDRVGRKAARDVDEIYSRSRLQKITVEINHRKFYLRNCHEGSFYFAGCENNNREIRVSTHWRCKSSRKVDHYKGYAGIPFIEGKIETYKGFAAVMY